MAPFDVAAFYRFVTLADAASLRQPVRSLCERHGVKGIVLLAPEGINGTLAGAPEALRAVMDGLAAMEPFAGLTHALSHADTLPFKRLKVRLKHEVVMFGRSEVDVRRHVGTYVEPRDWNALICDPDVTVIDTRNHFEVRLGTFAGAIDPQTANFSDFPNFVQTNLDPARHKRIAMFCTGGIRCEKASSYLLDQGFSQVFHLKGGILNYLDTVPAQDSLWRGGCFVFDGRIALGHGLSIENIALCARCQAPLPGPAASGEAKPAHCPACRLEPGPKTLDYSTG